MLSIIIKWRLARLQQFHWYRGDLQLIVHWNSIHSLEQITNRRWSIVGCQFALIVLVIIILKKKRDAINKKLFKMFVISIIFQPVQVVVFFFSKSQLLMLTTDRYLCVNIDNSKFIYHRFDINQWLAVFRWKFIKQIKIRIVLNLLKKLTFSRIYLKKILFSLKKLKFSCFYFTKVLKLKDFF